MNKFAKMMCLLAILALVGTSCKKNEETVTCKATFAELEVEDGAKSYLVGSRIQWEPTDNVVIFNTDNRDEVEEAFYHPSGAGNTVNLTPVNGGLTNTNTLGAFYGFYPANVEGGGYQSGSAAADGSHITARFLLPKEMQYREKNGKPVLPTNALACAGKDAASYVLSDVHFDMYPICGVLQLRFFSPVPNKKIERIVVTDKRFNTTGYLDLYIDMINSAELTEWINSYNESESYLASLLLYKQSIGYYVPEGAENPDLGGVVTLQCGNLPLSTNPYKPNDFYIPLRPLACYKGFNVDVFFTDHTYANAITTAKKNMIKPNVLKVMPVVSIENFINQ